MACNQSIGMVGQFFLLNNYINAGNQIDTVYLIYSPYSFRNNLDQVYTYHYFLKPFYNKEYKPLFTELVNKQIEKIPYHNFCSNPLILTSDWAPDFISKDKLNFTFLSPVSVTYLQKIKTLSIEHHFKLILLPPPTSISKKSEVEKMNRESEITKSNLTEEFRNYFAHFIYLPDINFSDGTHLEKPMAEVYTEYYKRILIK